MNATAGFVGGFGSKSSALEGPDALWEGLARNCAALHGDVYNTPALCGQLGLARDTPLQRVLPVAWQRWSVDMFSRLEGEFVLALRDDENLMLYRDPSGARNLYWHQGHDGQISYATSLSALLQMPKVGRRLARRSLHEYLRFLDISAPDTLFEGVQAVEAGQMLRCSAASVQRASLPAATPAVPINGSFSQAVDALGAHLHDAVRARLADSARPAAFLSGGVDSSLICTTAVRLRPDLTALTVGFDDARFDESPIAERVASHLGVAHRVLRFGRQDYLCAFEQLSHRMDQPMADPATMATVLAFEYCRDNFEGVLDGMGADEAVGTLPARHVRLATGYASMLPGRARRNLVRGLARVPRLAQYTPILDFEHPADTMIRWHGFSRAEIEALCGEQVSFGHTHFYQTYARFSRHAHFERYSALLNAMPGDRLTQAALVSGMQARYPFLDREVDAFIRQLPTTWRYLPGQPKRILRELLARYVPREIWDVPKHGFNFPLGEFMAAEEHALVRRYLDRARWGRTGLLAPDLVEDYGRRFIAGDQRLRFRVWALIVLAAWLEHHPLASSS